MPRKDPKPFFYIGLGILFFGIMASLPQVDNFLIDFSSMSLASQQMMVMAFILIAFHFLFKPAVIAIKNERDYA